MNKSNNKRIVILKQIIYAMENKIWKPRQQYSKDTLRMALKNVEHLPVSNDLKIRATILLLE